MDRFPFRSQGHGLRSGPPPPPPEPQPAPVVRYLKWARRIQADIDENGWTFRQAAAYHGISFPRVSQLLELVRLAPDIQERVLAMTTTNPSCYLTEKKLRLLVACELDWDRQRERFEKLLAGELRLPPPRRHRARRQQPAPVSTAKSGAAAPESTT